MCITPDKNDGKQSGGQRQRRKFAASPAVMSTKRQNSNNSDKSGSHRRGKSMANVGDLQGSVSKSGAAKFKGSKDDSDNKSEALESLQQIIASLKNLPAAPKVPKQEAKTGEASPTDVSKHRRVESSVLPGPKKRISAGGKQQNHKKVASVSFSLPLPTSLGGPLKPIPDAEGDKPFDVENALQNTISSLRRLSQDKGKAHKEKDVESQRTDDDGEGDDKNRRKRPLGFRKPGSPDETNVATDRNQDADVPKSPFDWKKSSDDQNLLSPKKGAHRRGVSLGYNLSAAAVLPAVASTMKAQPPSHIRRHSVALNGSKEIMKDIEKNKATGMDAKGHRRTGSRNFDGNWRSTPPFLSPQKFNMNQKKQPGNQQNQNNQQQRKSLFAPYLPQAQLPPLLKSGQLVSGTLRINKRNRSDAYVSTESLDADIYICGSKDRNRALEGDTVAVELLDPEKVWQTKKEKEEKKRRKEESAGIDRKKLDKKKDDVEVEGQGLLLFEDDDIISDDQRPKYCGHIVAVMERMPGQLFSGTLALLRPSSTATKEREAAERARREAEERAAGIEPKVEEPKDKEKQERPKIVWFKPTDKRVPLIAIPTEQAPHDFVENHQSYAQQLFVACIKRWPITSLHPFGTLVTQIGEIGNIENETEALLKDNNVSSEEFNENVLKCLPTAPWTIPDKEQEVRRDLRTTRIFTIDPIGSTDLDDAISCKRLPDGNYEIGVHIADVSYFVKPNTPLDREARKRATSVYLVQKSVHMLPEPLFEFCSLKSGVERLALSVIWKMSPDGRSLETWYGKTVIRPCATLSYENAQEVIEGNPLSPDVRIYYDHDAREVEADIKVFNELSQIMRENRLKRGALSLNSTKLSFELGSDNNPTACHVVERKEAHRLIEEFMLLANMSVAQRISSAFPEQAILRRHAQPLERRMDEIAAYANRFGFESFDCSLASSLQGSLDKIPDKEVKEVLEHLAIKPMQRAKYFCTGTLDIAKYHHYALNVPLFTHYTSPIRRYADILVHRMLEAALVGDKRFYLDKDNIQKTANHCNIKKDAAKQAREQSNHLFLCVILNNLSNQFGPVIREAIVLGVKDHAFDVLVPAFGIEKRVHLDQLPLEKFRFNPESHELLLQWRSGVSSLEPLRQAGTNEDDEEGLDVDEEALLEAGVEADDNEYHQYELMDVATLPIDDESGLFDDISDGYEDVEEEDEGSGASSQDPPNVKHEQQLYIAGPASTQPEAPNDASQGGNSFTDNMKLSSNTCTQMPKPAEPPKLSILSDASIPNSQIIKELGRVQVYVTADCKKSPPVIKVLAANPYEKKDV